MYSYWNYRVVQESPESEDFTIREVYYLDGKPAAFSGPIEPFGESLDELKDCILRMQQALEKPVLLETEVKFDYQV